MKKLVRWAPAVVAPVAVVAVALTAPAVASASSSAPTADSVAQVIELVEGSADAQYSGRVEQTSELGLPELPQTSNGMYSGASGSFGGGDAAEAITEATADHELRVFVGGSDRQRVQVLDELAERDVVRNGSTVWLYDSAENTAVRAELPADAADAVVPGDAADLTPAQLADRFLDEVGPSTDVTVDEGTRVAGRAAYRIVLDPRTDGTLVDSVAIAVDAETGVPLQVVVQAVGQDAPALQVGFTSIDYTAPDAGLFDFTPPAGAEVTEKDAADAPSGRPALPRPVVTGEDWTSIAAVDTGSSADRAAADPEFGDLLGQLTTPVDGGQGVQTSLVSVLLTDDGRVLTGAVPLDALVEAAAAG
jgi:outer membrane lipoprotein-sorting protein